MKYDSIIVNGTVYDPLTERAEVRMLGVKNGRICFPETSGFHADDAEEVIDASGKYVLPGLIDEHAHLYLHGSIIGANADTVCIPSGVTTAVDGGTTGASGFELFLKTAVLRSEAEMLAYLNVSTFGNKSLCLHEEDHDPADFRADLIRDLFERYPATLKGLKVRMCKATLGEYGISPLVKTIAMAEEIAKSGRHCPVVVHYGDLPENVKLSEILTLLRPGDILAHVFQTMGETIYDENGDVLKAVKEAQKRGVYMDSCNGRVHWSFENLERAIRNGFYPDIISSDLVRPSEYKRPGFSLLHAMSVFSAAGMAKEKIFNAVTINPANALGISEQAGIFREGAPADITILDITKTDMVFRDKFGGARKGSELFIPLLTMRKGRTAYRQIFF